MQKDNSELWSTRLLRKLLKQSLDQGWNPGLQKDGRNPTPGAILHIGRRLNQEQNQDSSDHEAKQPTP